MSLGVLYLLINKRGSFTVPVAFIVNKRVTLFFDFFTPESGPVDNVLEGSNSQSKPNNQKNM